MRGGAADAHGGATTLALELRRRPDGRRGDRRRDRDPAAGDDLCFAMTQADPWGEPAAAWSPAEVRRRVDATVATWHSWSDLHQRYTGPWRDLVHHSGVVLQGLTYARSGAMVAAPTTSLPEGVGSGRTWDYRFTWVRDASMTMQGLYVAACPDEAERFFTFLARAAATQLDRGLDLQIMYGIGGERDLTERTLDRTWPGGGTADRSGSGTTPGRSVSSTSTAPCSTPRTCSGTSWTISTRPRALPGRRGRGGRRPLDGRRPGDLGDPRAGPAVPAQQADVLGRPRPRHPARRAAGVLTIAGRSTGGRAYARRSATAIETRGWSERAGAYTQVLRLRRPGRIGAADGHVGLPAARRPAAPRDHRRGRGRTVRRSRPDLPIPRARTASTPKKAASCSARSGWPKPWP